MWKNIFAVLLVWLTIGCSEENQSMASAEVMNMVLDESVATLFLDISECDVTNLRQEIVNEFEQQGFTTAVRKPHHPVDPDGLVSVLGRIQEVDVATSNVKNRKVLRISFYSTSESGHNKASNLAKDVKTSLMERSKCLREWDGASDD